MSDRRSDPSADASRAAPAPGPAWSADELRAFALIDDPVWVHAVGAPRLLWGNDAACRFWGHADPAALAGRRPSARCAAALAALGAPAAEPRVVVFAPDGRPQPMRCTATAIRFAGAPAVLVHARAAGDPARGGTPAAIDARLRQSHAELARMAAELRQSEARLRDFAECGSDWFYELDGELRFSYLSEALDSVTGEDRRQLLGRRPTRDGLLEVDDAAWAAHQADLAAHRPIRDFRFGRAGPDGSTRMFSVTAKPVFDGAGTFRGYRGVGRDITAADESKRLQRAVLDAFPGAVNVKTTDRRFVFMNAFQARLHGVAAQDAAGKTLAELLGRDYDPVHAGNDARVIATGEPLGPYAGIMYAADGRKRDWLAYKVPLKNLDGRVTHVVSAAIDITALKETERALEQARAALAENEARLRDFASASSDWFWEQDENCRFTFVSMSGRRSPTIAADNLIGKRRRETNAEGVSEERWAAHEADLAARRPFADFEFDRTMPDGSRRHLSVSGIPVFDSAGNFKGYRGTGSDITARVAAEQAARASGARFRDFAESASDWFWEHDAEGRFIFLSDSIERVTGIPPRDHYGKRPQDFRPADDRADAAWAAYAATVAGRAPIVDFRMQRMTPDGRRRHLRINGKPLFDEAGRFSGYRGTGTDITQLVEAEAALQTSERRFRDFASATGHYVWEADADDRLTFIDEGYERIYGVPGATYLGTKPSERPTAAGRDLSTDPMEAMRAKRLPFKDVVVTRRHRDGRDVHLSMCGKPIFDADGTYRGYRGTGSDVTALVEAERALKESEQRYRDFAAAAGHYVWETDAESRLVHLGEGYERIFGIPVSRVIGTRMVDPNPNDPGRAEFGRRIEALRATRRPFVDVIVPRHLPDGRTLHLSVSGKPVFDEAGNFKGYRGINRDVTELVNAQAALKDSEQRFRDFASAAGHWVWEIDSEDRVTMVGEGFERVTGVPCETVIGKRAYAVRHDDPRRVAGAAMLKRCLAAREPFMDVVLGWTTKDGRSLSLALSGKPVFDETGAFRGFRGVTRDVTAQAAAEAEAERLRSERDLAAGADRAKTQFLANMSHELRTPLNAIIGFSEIMVSGLFGPIGNSRYASYAADIANSARHLLDVINDLLDMSRIELDRREIDCVDASLDEIVREAAAIAAGLAIDSARALTGLTMFVDKRAIKQVLVNLLSNAVKFTEPGGRIELAARRCEDGTVEVTVSDTGIGIPAREMPTLFEAFAQSDARKARGGGGAGLGLWISRALARLHNGDLTVASVVGRGTVATLTLPGDRLRRSGDAPPRRAANG